MFPELPELNIAKRNLARAKEMNKLVDVIVSKDEGHIMTDFATNLDSGAHTIIKLIKGDSNKVNKAELRIQGRLARTLEEDEAHTIPAINVMRSIAVRPISFRDGQPRPPSNWRSFTRTFHDNSGGSLFLYIQHEISVEDVVTGSSDNDYNDAYINIEIVKKLTGLEEIEYSRNDPTFTDDGEPMYEHGLT